ncbi:TetR family transcriptional regulator [Zavarzinia sp. CC-PAN008]|uniref:TetR family transcriptional regulator n=1 Tax=Zavarzinia sp. CC-PAN008 TaxID=3243332 RepID=UPI003F742027
MTVDVATVEAPRPLSRREGNKLQKQAALFDAAMVLFAQRSFEAVSVDEICAAAGIGRATFFRLFGHKAGLLEELHRRVALAVDEQVAEADARGLAALRLTGAVMAERWTENETIMHDIVAEYVRNLDAVHDVGEVKIDASHHGSRAMVRQVARYIRQGQEAGDIRTDLEPTFAAILFMSQVGMVLTLWASGRQEPAGAEEPADRGADLKLKLDQALSIMLRGLSL